MKYEERTVYLSDYMSKAVEAKSLAQKANNEALDVAAEFGYEMGAMSEKSRIESEIDALIQSLTDNEEDAKLTLEIVKQIVARTDIEENE